MESHGGHVMTIANSIIGVSILAMPYCFKQCGIILSSLMLILSSIISRLSCHFLLKSAIISKNKTIEYLAFFVLGPVGKLTVELGIIGFLLGTCIAFFVVMGDLGPQIIAEMVGIPMSDTLRTSVLICLAVFCVLPLGLLRNVDSLTSICTAAIGFYICLVLKIMAESAPHIMNADWYDKVEFWRVEGILQCLPIFSMALFCQTQLFEIYQAIPNASLDRMNGLIRSAVNICTCVYIFVGIFGYIAVANQPFTGNILLSFQPSLITEIIKIGFIMSVAVSFPLIIFPCRASLFSMIFWSSYPKRYQSEDRGRSHIPVAHFRYLTVGIITISLVIGIMIPNIELVLGVLGSTIGVLICVLFPATAFICASKKNTNERLLAQVMLFVGMLVMVLGTYANLKAADDISGMAINDRIAVIDPKRDLEKKPIFDIPTTVKISTIINNSNHLELNNNGGNAVNEVINEIRHEPPQPVEPEPEREVVPKLQEPVAPDPISEEKPNLVQENKLVNEEKKSAENIIIPEPQIQVQQIDKKIETVEQVDIEAIKKEDKEIKQQEQEEKTIALQQIQKQTIDLLKKQEEKWKEIQSEHEKQDNELKAKKIEVIAEIEHIAKNAIETVAELDKQTERNVLRDLIQPRKAVIELNDMKPNSSQANQLANPAPLSYQLGLNVTVNVTDAKKVKSSLVPENFIPLPIVKANLTTYNIDLTINNSINKIKEIVEPNPNKMVEVIKTAELNPANLKIDNTQKEQKESKSENKEKTFAQHKEELKAEDKIAMDSLRRDILSVNPSRRDVKDEINCENCKTEKLPEIVAGNQFSEDLHNKEELKEEDKIAMDSLRRDILSVNRSRRDVKDEINCKNCKNENLPETVARNQFSEDLQSNDDTVEKCDKLEKSET